MKTWKIEMEVDLDLSKAQTVQDFLEDQVNSGEHFEICRVTSVVEKPPLKLIIKQDTNPENGKKDRDNLGTMVCWHGRYNLGDKQPGGDPNAWERNYVPEGSVVLRLYLLDHSGITMRCEPFSCPWDSGQVGIIFTSPERIKEEYEDASDESKQKARDVMKFEVKDYDCHLRGQVWGYEYGEDSCWGFVGDELEDTGLKETIPKEALDQLEAAWEARA